MKKLGLDLGTKHIVVSYRDGTKIKSRYEVNGYLVLPKAGAFTEELLIKNGVPYVIRDDEIIAIGSRAEKLAYTFNKTLKRPMAEGGVSKDDDDAQEIMAIIIKSMIGKLDDDAVIYYCTTANPINSNLLNISFHKKIVELMIASYAGESKNVRPFHINEARCLIIDEQDAAIGISWGAGTVTVHAGIMGIPIFEFSIVGSGDWLDTEVAKRFGYNPDRPLAESKETPTTVARVKEQIDLAKQYDDKLQQAIVLMYEILVENVVSGIISGFNQNKGKFRFDKPISVINAGGTSMPAGFIELFRKKMDEVKDKLGVPIGEIKRANEPLFAVSHGCLKAAELHKD